MTSTDAAAEARETVYAAIELSKKTWVLGIAPPDRDVRAFTALRRQHRGTGQQAPCRIQE